MSLTIHLVFVLFNFTVCVDVRQLIKSTFETLLVSVRPLVAEGYET